MTKLDPGGLYPIDVSIHERSQLEHKGFYIGILDDTGCGFGGAKAATAQQTATTQEQKQYHCSLHHRPSALEVSITQTPQNRVLFLLAFVGNTPYDTDQRH